MRVYNTSWNPSLSWTGPLYIAIMLVITYQPTWSSRRLEVGEHGVWFIKSLEEFWGGIKKGVLIRNWVGAQDFDYI